MTSVIAPQVLSSSQALGLEPKCYNELECLEDAVQTYTRVLLQAGSSAVRLHCSIPTWSPQSNQYLDLHDLHHLRSKSLVLIHDLVNSLRSSGVVASYSLNPSPNPMCLVSVYSPGFNASRIIHDAAAILQNAHLTNGDQHVLLANLECCPSLIIC